jgi:hypothetical protein
LPVGFETVTFSAIYIREVREQEPTKEPILSEKEEVEVGVPRIVVVTLSSVAAVLVLVLVLV